MHVEIGREYEHSVRVWTRCLGHFVSVHKGSKEEEMVRCLYAANFLIIEVSSRVHGFIWDGLG